MRRKKKYISFTRLLLEYSDVILDNCSQETKKDLDAIYVEAARIISGATKLYSIEKLFTELGWEFLQSHRNKHKFIVFHKTLQGLIPGKLSDLVPTTVQATSRYNLKISEDIQNFRANTYFF